MQIKCTLYKPIPKKQFLRKNHPANIIAAVIFNVIFTKYKFVSSVSHIFIYSWKVGIWQVAQIIPSQYLHRHANQLYKPKKTDANAEYFNAP